MTDTIKGNILNESMLLKILKSYRNRKWNFKKTFLIQQTWLFSHMMFHNQREMLLEFKSASVNFYFYTFTHFFFFFCLLSRMCPLTWLSVPSSWSSHSRFGHYRRCWPTPWRWRWEPETLRNRGIIESKVERMKWDGSWSARWLWTKQSLVS